MHWPNTSYFVLFFIVQFVSFFMFFKPYFYQTFCPSSLLSRFLFFSIPISQLRWKLLDSNVIIFLMQFQWRTYTGSTQLNGIFWRLLEIWLINWNNCCSTSWCLTFFFSNQVSIKCLRLKFVLISIVFNVLDVLIAHRITRCG